ncbi:MAG: hypothetical protein PF689_08670 [Deltaproteobacteria bacterium]|jgi:hypothetical protein|nr:hypothetical protein [Deltaproteobacteria bacterium]
MRRRKNKEIMVFSISFLDVIASALGAILILFIIQYNKTIDAKVEVEESEQRHNQCAQVLEWMYINDNTSTIKDQVVISKNFKNKKHNSLIISPVDTNEAKETENNIYKKKNMIQQVEPRKVVDKKEKKGSKKSQKTQKASRKNKTSAVIVREKPDEDTEDRANEQKSTDKDLKVDLDTEEDKQKSSSPAFPDAKDKKQVDAGKVESKSRKPGKTEKSRQQLAKHKAKDKKPQTEEQKKKAKPKKPPKPKTGYKALATCTTEKASVQVAFYDHDEPDGDTIMVSFNGRHGTKLRLEKRPTKYFKFNLRQGKYNIISIKNISNGFYPINTANVYVSGCGRAKWKIKKVGVTRVIYIYRK